MFAAASLTGVFTELARVFESKNSGVSVRLNFAGSQRLRSQLESGAKADVFASADAAQMALVAEAGLIAGQPAIFAASEMAVIVSEPHGAAISGLKQLADPGVSVVLAHPSVPAGSYSLALLKNLAAAGDPSFQNRVLANVVSEETSVRNVEQKVVLGEVDAGIVYAPGALSAMASGNVRRIAIPEEYNVRAEYPIAALKGSRHPEVAREFVSFLASDTGKEILVSHGFDSP